MPSWCAPSASRWPEHGPSARWCRHRVPTRRWWSARSAKRSARSPTTSPAGPWRQAPPIPASEILVIRPRTAFRRHPGDAFVGILDVAGLPVHAVGPVDLQAQAVRLPGVVDHLVDDGGTAVGEGVAVLGHAANCRTEETTYELQSLI